jgi:hypothetical protein
MYRDTYELELGEVLPTFSCFVTGLLSVFGAFMQADCKVRSEENEAEGGMEEESTSVSEFLSVGSAEALSTLFSLLVPGK